MSLPRTAAAIALGFSLTATSGCGLMKERVCDEGQYPAKYVGTRTGQACFDDGTRPDEGYVRYPDGQEPEYVGDTWDRKWADVVLDADGRPVAGNDEFVPDP